MTGRKKIQKKKAIVFDFDGVLVKAWSSWLVVHRYFHVKENDRDFDLYMNGGIDYPEFMRRDIAKWPVHIHISKIETALFSNYTLMKNAKETIKELKQRGFEIGIVSCGINLLVNKVAKDLEINLDYVLANGLETDEDGCLTGEGIVGGVELLHKDIALRRLGKIMNVPIEKIIAVGDSRHDIPMLKKAKLGVAFNPKDREVRKAADIVIEGNDLSKILKLKDLLT